ncbi:hypothetical protein [Winogradskyella luteola]|uniref:Uncharacterized protein n=1 Tax=Winogradskyella luteola TaxID=2828330 RepID=A0A9X1F792_9FLAO|nr:hypothetical protein [Winogradskyella luteola]MBV7267738.1 hypothetical protein [Winogradskyella luteola]
MNPLAEIVYMGEIVLQSEIAKRAENRLPVDPGNFDHIEVWCSIQSILVAAGNISKILWSHSNDKSIARSKRLRKMLNIDDNNILSNRKFRNHFEHYDERIQIWFENKSSSIYIDLSFNPFKPTKWSLPKNSHREYNQVNRILTFRGETLDLKEVLNAIEEIKLKCKPHTLM